MKLRDQPKHLYNLRKSDCYATTCFRNASKGAAGQHKLPLQRLYYSGF